MSIRITSLRAGMPGFVTGVARLLDFGGALHVQRRHYQPGLPPGLADYLAIQSDWMATGQDIQRAISVLDPTPGRSTEQWQGCGASVSGVAFAVALADVSDVAALDEEDDLLREVGRVVANALEGLIHRLYPRAGLDEAGVFVHQRQ